VYPELVVFSRNGPVAGTQGALPRCNVDSGRNMVTLFPASRTNRFLAFQTYLMHGGARWTQGNCMSRHTLSASRP
jgi:hypothetical protein